MAVAAAKRGRDTPRRAASLAATGAYSDVYNVRVAGDAPGRHLLASAPLAAALEAQRDAVYAALEMDGPGWALIRGAFELPDGFADLLRSETDTFGNPIFQNAAPRFPQRWGDGRRLQYDISAGDDYWLTLGRALQRFTGAFFPGRVVDKEDSIVSLLSRKRCGPQAPHADYHPDPVLWQPACSASTSLPLGLVMGVQPGSSIRVWSGSHRHLRDFVVGGCTTDAAAALPPIPVTIVEFCAGDAFVFRPDVIHAGDAFEIENVRCHCFLDTAALPGYVRRENGTFIPSDAEASKHYVPLGNLFLPHPDDERREALFEMQAAGAVGAAMGCSTSSASAPLESGPTGIEQLLLVQQRVKAQRPKKRGRRKAPLRAAPHAVGSDCNRAAAVAALEPLVVDAAATPPSLPAEGVSGSHCAESAGGSEDYAPAVRLFGGDVDDGAKRSAAPTFGLGGVAAASSAPPPAVRATEGLTTARAPVGLVDTRLAAAGDIDVFSGCDPDCCSRRKNSSFYCLNCS